jgi:hypothetical protein
MPVKSVRYWLCYDGKNVVGPYLQSSLKRWLAFGFLSEKTPACAADQQTWITVQEIPGIYEWSKRLKGDLEYRREHPYTGEWHIPATERQRAFLAYLGSPCPLGNVSKGLASELIDALVEQFPDKIEPWNNQPATEAQKERLSFLKVAYPNNITLGQAQQLLTKYITPENRELWEEHKSTEKAGVSVSLTVGHEGGVSIETGEQSKKAPSFLSKLTSHFRGQ